VKLLARLIALLLLGAICGAAWIYRAEIDQFVRQKTGGSGTGAPAPDPDAYEALSLDLESHRERLARRYESAANPAERAQVLADVRRLLEGALPGMMRCWLGTPWDFNGTAHEPGGGKVACGYFVSSVMQDAGFVVEWAPLAQQPSQNILRTFLPAEEMTIRVGLDYEEFLDEIRSVGPGVYIVGLDSHVAFLVVTHEDIRFIHSSGASPWCVVDESVEAAHTLRRSRYRVSGNLTAHPEFLANWLLKKPFLTKKG
jgi:hypothetical protein